MFTGRVEESPSVRADPADAVAETGGTARVRKHGDGAGAYMLTPHPRGTYCPTMAPSPARRARAGRLAGTSVIAAAVLLAGMPSVAFAAVQPKPGTIYTGGAGNGGKVTLELKRTWNSTTERVYMAPFITWTKVKAVCDIWNGTEFVPTPKRITARLQITRWEGRVRKGRFSQTETYNGAPQWTFNGRFTKRAVTGKVHKITTYGIDTDLGYGCKWGPLTFDLAAN